MNAFQKFQDAVHKAGLKTDQVRSSTMMVQCPVHDDDSPSLSVKYAQDKVLMNCHGCQADVRDIAAALGLAMEDLFDGEPDKKTNKMPVAEYRYMDGRTGEIIFVKKRFYPKTFAIFHYDSMGDEVFGLPNDVKPWLYNIMEVKAALDNEQPIWLVEGEADVHAIEAMGGVATTQAMGAGRGKWKPFHTWILKRAKEVRIVMDLDEDWYDEKDGKVKNTGRDYALEVRQALVDAGIRVTMWKSASGKDASDHRAARLGLDDFIPVEVERVRPKGITGAELSTKVFPELIYAVDGILPQGVAILAASPKAGKSFIAVDMAVGVAVGGKCLSRLQCTQGDVLYVGLEDSERRLKDRIELLCDGHWPDLSRIEFQTIDSGWEGGAMGMVGMNEWAMSVKEPRLIVIDTLGKAEPDLDDSKNRYLAEQEMMLRYKQFADRHDCTVLFVHHNRKSEGDDWLDKFSGSKGLTGGADTLLYVDYKRGERDGFLRVEGRDVVADDIPITKVAGRPFWKAMEAPSSLGDGFMATGPSWTTTALQTEILDLLSDGLPRDASRLRAALPGHNITEDLDQLVRVGAVKRDKAGLLSVNAS